MTKKNEKLNIETKEITIPIFNLTTQKENLISIQIGKGKYLTGNPFPQKSNTYSNNNNFNIDLRDERDWKILTTFIPTLKTKEELSNLEEFKTYEIRDTFFTQYTIYTIYKTLTEGKGKTLDTNLKETKISIKMDWIGNEKNQPKPSTSHMKKKKKDSTKKNKDLDILNDIEL